MNTASLSKVFGAKRQLYAVVIEYSDGHQEVTERWLTEPQARAFAEGFNANRKRRRMVATVQAMDGGVA